MKTKQIFSFFLLLVMMIGVQGVWGQALVFYESFGSQTLSSSVTVAAHTGYDNYGGTYAVTGNSSSIRTTTPSISGGTEQYSGASGGNLLFMNSTSATCTFSGISTMGYEVTGISFGWHKAATVSSPINLTGYDYSLKVEYSVDGGTNWTTANLTSWICPTKRDENNDIRQGDGTSFYATAGSVG